MIVGLVDIYFQSPWLENFEGRGRLPMSVTHIGYRKFELRLSLSKFEFYF
jgi:hypothetical protein